MALRELPFNIFLLDPDKRRLTGLLPVQSMDIYTSSGEFHPHGLYSIEIFGDIGSEKRQTQAAYIDIRTEVMHPKIFTELIRLKNLYHGILSGKSYAIWDHKLKDFIKSDIIDGQTGYSFFMNHFHEMVHATNDSSIRELRINLLNKYHENCMYRYIVVIPAALRDIEINEQKRVVEDEINTLYRKLIRASNTISIYNKTKENDPILDTVRWNLQSAFNEIYQYIESILEGKKGFLLSKWASRKIHGGTRNVITALDPAPAVLGAKDAVTVNDTLCGLHQYMKGTTESTIYNIRSGVMAPILNALPLRIMVIDPVTLLAKQIEPSMNVIDNWGTEKGLEKAITGFGKLDARHKPILLDGNYAALVYNDSKHIRVFYDITELPHGFSKANVSPITWAELFYLSVYKYSKKVAGYITRYPIIGIGSIYPSFIHLKTTVKCNTLQPLNSDWKVDPNEEPINNYPIKNEIFFDSMSVHCSKVPGLQADYDGDKCSLTIVESKEAVNEVKEYLNSKAAFIETNGRLRYGVNNHIATLVLYSFSRGLVNHV